MQRRDERLTALSKKLSWLLRHGALESRLEMDAAGFCAIADVLRKLALTRETLDRVVEENTKSRLQVVGDRIRACQGHSLSGTPVTLEGLEASWEPWSSSASVWHGTRVSALPGIGAEGILPAERTHVHLAPAFDSRVGKRDGVDVMLEVSPDRLRASGLGVFQSPNGVVLVRRVPVDCVVGLVAVVQRAQQQEPALRAHLGL